jgi:hypothetical protein
MAAKPAARQAKQGPERAARERAAAMAAKPAARQAKQGAEPEAQGPLEEPAAPAA